MTEEEKINFMITMKEVDDAVDLAFNLGLKSAEHLAVYQAVIGQCCRVHLWPEVCWSAGLKEGMTAEEFEAALVHGMHEWDL